MLLIKVVQVIPERYVELGCVQILPAARHSHRALLSVLELWVDFVLKKTRLIAIKKPGGGNESLVVYTFERP